MRGIMQNGTELHQVSRRLPESTNPYAMAEEDRVEQENAYEHMQTLRHSHLITDTGTGAIPKSSNMFSNGKVQAAILIAILLNFVLAISGLFIITHQKSDQPDLSGKVDEIVREISEVESRLRNDFQAINETLKEKEKKLNNLQASVNGVMGSSIRFAGGSLTYGRVEIFYNGIWGMICDDKWDINDAKVICRMRGFNNATAAPHGAEYGEGKGKIWLTDVECSGDEDTIWECDKKAWGEHINCGHDEAASAVCS